jgi:hypothetical protein
VSETVDIVKETETAGGFAALDPGELDDLVSPAPDDARPAEAAAVDVAVPAATVPPGVAPDEAVAEAAPVDVSATAAPVALKAVEARSRLRRHGLMLAVVCAALLATGGAAWVVLHHLYPPPGVEHPAPAVSEPVAADLEAVSSSAPAAMDRLEWEAVFREVEAFRRLLFDKRDEILRLQRHYDYGIRELEEEAVRLIKESGCGTLAAALKHPPLELLLQGIQRRQAYRDALGQPLRRLESGAEELLFLQRRAYIDLQVLDVAQGLDLQAQHQAIRSALRVHEPTVESLSIRAAGASASQELLWRRLAEQARQTTFNAEDRINQSIVAEACAGNLGRLAELTTLSLKGAGCLAESGTQELFLNRVNQLSPLAAQKLAEWPGRWLGLNGLKRLPPETARELFAWPGEWISLNGLSEMAPEAGRYLAGWRGRQVELMGLRRLSALDALLEWEASGGKLFVPGDIRQAVDTLRQAGNAPGSPATGQTR